VLALLVIRPVAAQQGEDVPGISYWRAVDALYAGEYRDAERALRRETNRGIQTTQTRWIDSICYRAMLGEVLYQQGRNPEALAEFDQACRLLLAYPDWLLRVRFREQPGPDPNAARRAPPWGRSDRQPTLGRFPSTMLVGTGQWDQGEVLRQGGVVQTPQFWRIHVAEIVRASALAIRRRNELLGPLGKYDPLSKELAEVFSRGGLSQPNHWSSAWVELQLGLAQAGVGRVQEAMTHLSRAVLVDGRYDHPLTCAALLEQGRLALAAGDHRNAARLLAEASFAAFYFDNWDVLTDSLWLGWINHMAAGGEGIYPPLPIAAEWARVKRLDHVSVKLRLAEAENWAWLNQLPQATAAWEDATRRLGQMRTGLVGIQQRYLQAILQLRRGQIGPGSDALLEAMAAQSKASLRNFQIYRTNEMFDARALQPRIAQTLYATLLGDPTPADWTQRPLDALAVMKTPHEEAFDRWFVAALDRENAPLALEVSEQAKRRRFLVSLPLGGRLLALREILETAPNLLPTDASLQRQQLLNASPAYRDLAAQAAQTERGLQDDPLLAQGKLDDKSLADRFDDWNENAETREHILLQMAVSRLPATILFPPLRKTEDLQRALADKEALVVFHTAGGNLYGFLVTDNGVHIWQPTDVRRLPAALSALLRDLGNYSANRSIAIEDLKKDDWQSAAAAMYQMLLDGSRLDPKQTTSLIIVPDGLLWHLPFEVLVLPDSQPPAVLADRMLVRYGPTAALAIGDRRPLRRTRHTGISVNEYGSDDADDMADEAWNRLAEVVAGPLRLPTPLPQPGFLVAPLVDELIVLDDLEVEANDPLGWSPLPRARNRAADNLSAWLALPYGGPERVVLTGFPTAAEQALKSTRRSSARGPAPGNEMFQSLCGLMSTGARTILITRWRTGGRTNLDLVREFVRELPNLPAPEAWQRSVLLARETQLDAGREPRLKRPDAAAEPPRATHPFFWAGYLLVDNSPRVNQDEEPSDDPADKAPDMPPPGKLKIEVAPTTGTSATRLPPQSN
jgi:hypothetical protein